MALENVANFINLVREAPELRIRLDKIQKEISESYKDRTPTDEERRAAAEKYIIPLANSVGLDFTIDELAEFVRGRKNVSQEELDLDDLEMVGAGKSYCVLSGFSVGEHEDGGMESIFDSF